MNTQPDRTHQPAEAQRVELILGGARSGKSSLAEQYATDSALAVIYVATAAAADDEMSERIAHHQSRRPEHWKLVEEPLALAEVIRQHARADNCLLVDCLTLWLTNQLLEENGAGWPQARSELLAALSEAPGRVILVGNEVGQGIVPLGELSRRFVDEAGWLHQAIARQAQRVIYTVAGLPHVLKDETVFTASPEQAEQR